MMPSWVVLLLAVLCSALFIVAISVALTFITSLTKAGKHSHHSNPHAYTPSPAGGPCNPLPIVDSKTGEAQEIAFEDITLYFAGPKPGNMSDANFSRVWTHIKKFLSNNARPEGQFIDASDPNNLNISIFQMHIEHPQNPASNNGSNYSANADLIAEALLDVPDSVRIIVHTEMKYNMNAFFFKQSDDLSFADAGMPSMGYGFYGGAPTMDSNTITAPGGNATLAPVAETPAPDPSDGSWFNLDPVCKDRDWQPENKKPYCMQIVDTAVWWFSYISKLMAVKVRKNSSKYTRKKGLGISGIVWDSEDFGPDPDTCAQVRILQSLERYYADLWSSGYSGVSAMSRSYSGFYIGNAGGASLSKDSVIGDTTKGCGQWWLKGKYTEKAYTVPGLPFPQPELYWISNGSDGAEDMGNSAVYVPSGSSTPSPGIAGANPGFAPAILDMGFVGCPQSSPNNSTNDNPFNYQCGCRQSVYEWGRDKTSTESQTSNDIGADDFSKLLTPIQMNYVSDTSFPLFSIERLGPANSTTAFSTCATTSNFDKSLIGADVTNSDAGVACAENTLCIAKCGVANFFGGWSKSCFKRMMQRFGEAWLAKFKTYPRGGVYEASFLPPSWVYSEEELLANPNLMQPEASTGAITPAPQNDEIVGYQQWMNYNDKYCGAKAKDYFKPDAMGGSEDITTSRYSLYMMNGYCPYMAAPFTPAPTSSS